MYTKWTRKSLLTAVKLLLGIILLACLTLVFTNCLKQREEKALENTAETVKPSLDRPEEVATRHYNVDPKTITKDLPLTFDSNYATFTLADINSTPIKLNLQYHMTAEYSEGANYSVYNKNTVYDLAVWMDKHGYNFSDYVIANLDDHHPDVKIVE